MVCQLETDAAICQEACYSTANTSQIHHHHPNCYLLDAIASPSTYPCQSVSDSFRFGDIYRISELCEFVYIFKIVIKRIQTWPYFFKMFSFIFKNCDKMNPSMFVLFILLKKLSFYIPSMANGHWPYFSTFYQTCDKI